MTNKKSVEAEKQQSQTEETLKKERRFRINYQWVVENLSFLFFLSLLALLYIANGHYAVKNIRAINETGTEVKELRWRYLDVKSDLMFRSKLSEVAKTVEPMGLKELKAPPQKIEATNKKENRQIK